MAFRIINAVKTNDPSQLVADEYSTENVFILDGIVSTRRGSERHLQLVSEIMRLPATKVVEHPDILCRIRSIRSMISIILSNSEMILMKSLHMNMQKNRKCLIRPVFQALIFNIGRCLL